VWNCGGVGSVREYARVTFHFSLWNTAILWPDSTVTEDSTALPSLQFERLFMRWRWKETTPRCHPTKVAMQI